MFNYKRLSCKQLSFNLIKYLLYGDKSQIFKLAPALRVKNLDVYKLALGFSKKILTLTAVILLISNIAFAKKLDIALGGMVGYGLTLHEGAGSKDLGLYNFFSFLVTGKYRPFRFLGLRTSLGIEINTQDLDYLNYLNNVSFDVAAGAELHAAKKEGLLDPYLFVEAGYPHPIGAGFGISLSPRNTRVSMLVEIAGNYRIGIKIEDPWYNNTRDLSGVAVSGRLGCLIRF